MGLWVMGWDYGVLGLWGVGLWGFGVLGYGVMGCFVMGLWPQKLEWDPQDPPQTPNMGHNGTPPAPHKHVWAPLVTPPRPICDPNGTHG